MDKNLAQKNWATRPADERFHGLEDWKESIFARNTNSIEAACKLKPVVVDLLMNNCELTNWSAFQLSSIAGIPQKTLAKLTPATAATALTELLPDDQFKVLLHVDAGSEIRAITSLSYGRIWDRDVAKLAEMLVNEFDLFPAPEWQDGYSACYASDRDCFIFLISGGSIVNAGRTPSGQDDVLHKGIFLWNSETGAATFGVDAFYFRQVCGNFSIFGFEEFGSIRIRHTRSAPDRFAYAALPSLQAWLDTSARPTEKLIHAAQQYALPADTEDIFALTNKFDFTPKATKEAIDLQIAREGECRTLWQLHNGFTARAKQAAHRNTRLEQEKAAGDLLRIVA